MNSLKVFRVVAVAEAVSWLALIVATIVKYTTDPMQEGGVKIMGPAHGALFVAYVALALLVSRRLRWNATTTLLVLLESVLPFGGFAAARRQDLRTAIPAGS